MMISTLPIFFLYIAHVSCSEIADDKLENIEKIYMRGVEAYHNQQWSLCVGSFEEVIHLTRLLNNVISNCRISCQNDHFTPAVEAKIEDLQIYERFIKRTKCLSTCQRRGFKTLQLLPAMSRKIAANIKALDHYTYLHICYFHRNDMQKAASAAYTYVIYNNLDLDMRRNLEYYMRQPEVGEDLIINFEAKNYVLLFRNSIQAYKKEKWVDCIVAAEEALQDYLISENECRALCEGPFDQGWLPDMVTSVANHFTYALQCKQSCQNQLFELEFKSGIDFLTELLNYLQITYYRIEKYKQAANAVESILWLDSKHEDMLVNKNLYKEYVPESEFKPLSQIVFYSSRDAYEKKLLRYIEKHFSTEIVDNVLYNY